MLPFVKYVRICQAQGPALSSWAQLIFSQAINGEQGRKDLLQAAAASCQSYFPSYPIHYLPLHFDKIKSNKMKYSYFHISTFPIAYTQMHAHGPGNLWLE